MWHAFLYYGSLFRPWIEGRLSPQEPLSGARIAPLRALTERYGTSTALAWALQRHVLTDELKSFAGLALVYGRAKVDRQLKALEGLVREMNAAGVTPLLLKGAAAQVGGIYPDAGFRLMADIDLLVPTEQLAAAAAAAERMGFAAVPSPEGAASHALSQYNEEVGLLLEVHWRLARVHARDNFPAEVELAMAREAEFRGARVLLPDWTRHAALTIVHAVAWHRSRYMALIPIKALLDIAALKTSGVQISWTGVEKLLEEAGERDSLVHFEVLFRALFDSPLTDIAIPHGRQKRILRYYALGTAYPVLHNLGLAATQFNERLMRAKRQPARLLQLFRPRFYGNLARALRRALDPNAALH